MRVLCFHGYLEAGCCMYIVFPWLQGGTLLYVYSVYMVRARQVAVHGTCRLYSVSMVTGTQVAVR